MSDALHTILADPELQAWPHRSTTTIPVEDPAENTEQPFVTPRQDNADVPTPDTPAPSTEIAAAPVTGLTAAPDRAAPAPLNPLLITAAHPAAADRTAVGAADRDDTYLPPHANSASDADEPDEDATSGGAPNSPTAPLAFDEIARRRNPLGDKFGDAAEWLKSNWRRPKVLGAAAAAVVAAVTLTAWASAAASPSAAASSAPAGAGGALAAAPGIAPTLTACRPDVNGPALPVAG